MNGGMATSVRTTLRADATLPGLLRYFLRLGTTGFGGPVVLVERMRRDLQEARGWFTADEYAEGLAFAQLAPGPLAAQLALYLGWVRAGALGAMLVGVAFIGPSFAMVLALSVAYVRFGGLPWMRGAFYGIGAAVIALMAQSAWRLARRTVGREPLLWTIAGVNAVVTAWTRSESVGLIAVSGLAVLLARETRTGGTMPMPAVLLPSWLTTGIHGKATWHAVAAVAGYFAKAGALVFGSGLAIVPFLHGGVVQQMHWLDERQFLDAVAVSMITPGPVVITVAFIGFLVAGPLGAIAAAVGVFLPVFLVVVFVARVFHRLGANRRLRALIAGVIAATTGAIGGAVFVLGQRAITDAGTWAILATSTAVVLFAKRIPEPVIILVAGVVGIILRTHAA